MGFIENLRRQTRGKKEEEMRASQLRADAEAERHRREKDIEDLHHGRVKQSEEFKMKSFFPQLCEELKKIKPEVLVIEKRPNKYESIYNLDGVPATRWPNIKEDSIWTGIILSSRYVKKSVFEEMGWGKYGNTGLDYEKSIIGIEFTFNGEIIIHAGFGGSTKLALGAWEGNRQIQEEALGRAFNNPKRIKYHKFPNLTATITR